MSKHRVTLKMLSERTGFDKSTISRVLRGDKTLSIRAENLAHILKVAEQLQYVPDPAGRSLRSSRTFSLGAVIPSLQNQIHAQIVEGAYEVCNAQGYSLIIAQASTPQDQLAAIQKMVRNNRIEALLALTFRNEYSEPVFVDDLAVPIAAVNWKAPGFENWITIEERKGGRMATQYLLDLGHRKIAHLSGDLLRFNSSERFLGYQDALASAGIAVDPSLVITSGYTFEAGYQAMTELLDRRRGMFTAVFVVSMLSAAGAINALQKQGVRVPEDVSVMGFHDGLMAQVVTPRLSTIAFPLNDMGRIAAQGMIDVLEGKATSFGQEIPGGIVVARESTAALR